MENVHDVVRSGLANWPINWITKPPITISLRTYFFMFNKNFTYSFVTCKTLYDI